MKGGRRLTALAAATAIGCLVLLPGMVAAAAPGIRIEARQTDDGVWRLQASVTADDGTPASQLVVTFLAATDFFGDRWVPIGSASTDTSGTAVVLYTPTWNGEQQLVARVSGLPGATESQPLLIEVSGAVPGIASEPPDLPTVRAWSLPIGSAVVVSVWVVLASLFLSAVIGIVRRPGPRQGSASVIVVDGLQPVDSRIDGGSR